MLGLPGLALVSVILSAEAAASSLVMQAGSSTMQAVSFVQPPATTLQAVVAGVARRVTTGYMPETRGVARGRCIACTRHASSFPSSSSSSSSSYSTTSSSPGSSPSAASSSSSPSKGLLADRKNVFKAFYNDVWHVDMPEGHRFPMHKYREVRETLQRDAMHLSGALELQASPLASAGDLRTTHCREYINRYITGQLTPSENRNIGFPWSIQHVKRALSSVGGTLAATHSVCRDGYLFAGHVAGGTHHAFYDYGEGFCVFSDIAVSANIAMRDYGLERILIVDCDVHQGNGNAVLFASDRRVKTVSVHCAGNYFSDKQTSDLDVEMPPGCGDEEYLRALEEVVPRVFEEQRPQLTFFQAGVDPHENDRLGKMKITREGLRRRNELVYKHALQSGGGLVVTMGGGYPRDMDSKSEAFRSIVEAHADVYRQGAAAVSSYSQNST